MLLLPLAACSSHRAYSDDTIAQQVRENLASDVNLASQRIMVYADRGVVTLRGEIANKSQETLAVAAAQGVEGVDRVVSMLEVGEYGDTP